MTLDEPRILNRHWSDEDERFKMLRLHGGQSSPTGYAPPAFQTLFRPGVNEIYLLDSVYAYYLYSGEALTSGPSFTFDNGAAFTAWRGQWDELVAYALGDGVINDGILYRRIVAGTTATAPDADVVNWVAVTETLITAQLAVVPVNRGIIRVPVTQNNLTITRTTPLRLIRVADPVPTAALANLDLYFIIRLLRIKP